MKQGHYFYITPEEYEIAAKNGIDPHNLERRVRYLGWSKERSLTEPIGARNDRKHWSKIAEANGISYKTFTGRINNYGMSPEEAATKPLQDRKKIIQEIGEIRRVIPNEWVKLAKQNGISYHTLNRRLKNGMHPQQAVTMPIMSSSEAGSLGAEARRKSAKKNVFA